jgi:hypothetical protein
MLMTLRRSLQAAVTSMADRARSALREATRPLSLVAGFALDLTRSRKELLAENVVLPNSARIRSAAPRRHTATTPCSYVALGGGSGAARADQQPFAGRRFPPGADPCVAGPAGRVTINDWPHASGEGYAAKRWSTTMKWPGRQRQTPPSPLFCSRTIELPSVAGRNTSNELPESTIRARSGA